jgi:hypothetical protein
MNGPPRWCALGNGKPVRLLPSVARGSSRLRSAWRCSQAWDHFVTDRLNKIADTLDMKHKTDVVKTAISLGAAPVAHIVSPDARVAAGKALRDKIPREQHGHWNGARGRPKPVDLLHKSDVGRIRELIAIRYGRMLQSPFFLLSRGCRDHGRRSGANANYRPKSASVR